MRYSSAPRRALATSIAAALVSISAVRAATWNMDVDGNWSDALRWDGGVPNGIDAVADASTIDIVGVKTLMLDNSFTVGTLRFGDLFPDSNWVLARPAGNTTNVLTLNVTSGAPIVDVVNQSAEVAVPLAGTKGLTKTGPGVLFLTGENTYTGTTTISAGALVLGNAGLTGSLQNTQVTNSIGAAGGGASGGFEIRRAGSLTIAFPVVNPTNNQASGSFTINSGSFEDPLTGVTLTGVVRQNTLHVGRGQQFGRVFIGAGADISVASYFLGEQTGRTGQGVQSGGTVVVGGQMRVGHWPQADPVTGAANTTTPSTHTMNGGTLTLAGTFTANPQGTGEKNGILYLGIDSTGELTLNGGVIDAKALVLDNRGATAGTDRLTINGGTLRIGGVGNGNDSDLANIGSAIISNNTSATYAVSYTGGTIQATGNFLHAVDATLDNANGGITFDTNGAVITATGALSGTGGLTKSGAGTLLLKSAATYSGPTVVNGGTLAILGNVASSTITVNQGGSVGGSGDGITTGRAGTVTIAAGGTLAPGAFAGSAGTFTATTLTTSGDSRFDLSPTSTAIGSGVNDLVAVTGTLTFSPGSTITPVFPTLPTSGNKYLLFTSTTRVGDPTLSLDSASRMTFTLDTTSQPNAVQLSVSGSGAPLALTWKGNGTTNVWDVNNTPSWNNNTEKFFLLDTVTFDNTGDNTTPVSLVGTLQPGLVTVSGTKDYVFGGTGSIAGGAGLAKSDAGTLTINGTGHSFSGPVTITGGTVVAGSIGNVGQPSAIGSGNSVNITSATLRYTGPSATSNRSFGFGGTAGSLEITTAESVLTLSSAVTGSGKLIKLGPGTLALPAGNLYEGGTDILGGTVRLGGINNALGTNSAVRLDNGAVLEVNGVTGAGAVPRYDITVGANGGTISNTGAGVVNNAIYSSITLEGNLTISNTARYDLNGGTGNVTINGGTFSITKVGAGETWWSPNGGATVGDIIVNGGIFGVQSSENLGSLDHSMIVNAGGQLITFSGISNAKPVILNGGLLAANNSTSSWSGTVTLNGAGTTNRIGTITNGVGVTVFGQVTGPNGFETTGGVVDFQNPANNYGGQTLISAGTLRASLAGALPNTTRVVMTGGALDLAGASHPVAGISGTGGTVQGTGSLFVNQSEETTFGGTFIDTALSKLGIGSLTLTGDSVSTEPNTVGGGSLVVNGSLPGSVAIDGGRLSGNGTVGPVTLNAAGTLAPGSGLGILSAGNTNFNGGTFSLEINGSTPGTGYDQLNVTGTVTLSTNTPIALTLGYDPSDMVDTFVIVNNDGTEALIRSGFFTFNSTVLSEGATFSVGAQAFRITYAGGVNANDVVLMAIPEPGAALSLLGAAGVLLGSRRARRSMR
jgi:fibronectin-binding autotransporter adhesin